MSDFKTCSKHWDLDLNQTTSRALDPLDRMVMRDTPNKGRDVKRTKHNPREMAFAELWADESEPRPAINYGFGLVQDLFVTTSDRWPFMTKEVMQLTKRERMIAATCIQWLGTNCGFAFLQEALEKCGYKIVQERDV